jgi:T-complex protein 1 subunit zeta
MRDNITGKIKLGIQSFADALLVVPRTLAENSGQDQQEVLLKVVEAHEKTGEAYGVDVITGEAQPVNVSNIYDNYIVKRQFLNIAPVLAEQLLLVDEVMRAGKNMRQGGAEDELVQ